MKKAGVEDRAELYREFYQEMLTLGYAPFYIGKMLARIVQAVEWYEDK